jgi:hypothetical protein
MKYLLTIYGDEKVFESMPPDEAAQWLEKYSAFAEEATRAGVLLGGEGLQPTSTATTVRVREGERVLSDGPFVETKETLGGYFLIECDNLDQAIDWAEKVPGSWHGAVEVRPVMDYEGMADHPRETAVDHA